MALLDLTKDSHEDAFSEWANVRVRKACFVSIQRVPDLHWLTVLVLDEEDAFDRDGGVCVDDLVGGIEMLDEKWKDRDELLLRELVAECV